MARRSLLVVIDASVARSAGLPGESSDPRSIAARDLLLSVMQICHRMAYPREVRREWQRHRSRFTATWLKSMFARRKIVMITEELTDEVLRRAISESSLSARAKRAVLKDVHLVETALGSDNVIISFDAAARAEFERLAYWHRRLLKIRWFDGNRASKEGRQWLEDGCPPLEGIVLEVRDS